MSKYRKKCLNLGSGVKSMTKKLAFCTSILFKIEEISAEPIYFNILNRFYCSFTTLKLKFSKGKKIA